MSRVDFIVDGETEVQAHQDEPDDVRISFNGGKTFISPEAYEHVVVEVTTYAGKNDEQDSHAD